MGPIALREPPSVIRGASHPDSIGGRGPATRTLTNLQVLRAAAAVSVMLFHASHYVSIERGERVMALFDGRFGLFGVEIFFAISGFLMASLARTTPAAPFLSHRIIRIFPAYLATALVICLGSLWTSQVIPVDWIALSLAPAGLRKHPVGIEWTLVFETSFYVLVFATIAAGLGRRIEIVAAAWMAVLAAAYFTLPASARNIIVPPAYLVFVAPACVAFVGGLLLPWATSRGICRPILALPACAAFFVPVALSIDAAQWIGGAAAFFLVGGAIQAPQLRTGSLAASTLVRLGDWSYVIYLIHVRVVLSVCALAPAAWSAVALWCAAVAAVLAASTALGPLEVATYRRLKRKVDALSDKGRWTLCLAYLGIFLTAATVGSAIPAWQAYQLRGADTALLHLPAQALVSREASEAAIRGAALARPGTMHGAIEAIEIPTKGPQRGRPYLKAWAVDPDHPDEPLVLAAYCQGRRVAFGRALRLRPDPMSGSAAGGAQRHRIGYLLPMKTADCATPDSLVGIVVDREGRLAVLGP